MTNNFLTALLIAFISLDPVSHFSQELNSRSHGYKPASFFPDQGRIPGQPDNGDKSFTFDKLAEFGDTILTRTESRKNTKIGDKNTDEINDLPVKITEAEVHKAEAPLAFLVSGDGGWFSFEQSIADNLAKDGIPTVGLDSRKYFWNRKTPDKTALDMEELLKYYGKKFDKNRIVMIGYSLGAEIVPFIVSRFSADLKSEVKSVVLLSPETKTDFEIHISNMLGMGNSSNTYDVLGEIFKIDTLPVLIIFGSGEKSKIPALLKETRVTVRIIPGDHHYKFDLPLIIQTMRDNKVF